MQTQGTNKLLPKFFTAAVIFLGWGVIQGALQAQKPIHDFIANPPADIIVGAHAHVNLLGWVSLALAGIIYYLIPILTSKPIAAPRLINWIFWGWTISIALMGIFMIAGGIAGGNASAAGTTGAALDSVLTPYMIPVGILSILMGITVLAFVIQILSTIGRKPS
jgi:cbb3-type cytochrome oxidase subunit 1